MIRIRVSKKPAACVGYFLGDAALSSQEKVGVWHGRACAALGVEAGSQVKWQDLALILDGYTANGRNFLGWYRRDRRCAYDMVVSASKSVSLSALCWEKEGPAVKECFRDAAHSLVPIAERLARRQGSEEFQWKTGTLAAACFVHESSRYGDPHLHSHLLVSNVTDNNGRFWALSAHSIYQETMVLDGIFQRDLTRRLQRCGYKAELKKGVAVLPVPEDLCRQYSKGHNAIEQVVDQLAARGVEEGRLKSLAQVINDRVHPRRKRSNKRPSGHLGLVGERPFEQVRGTVLNQDQPWGRQELWLWLRRELRGAGMITERTRWKAALGASLRDLGQPIDGFLNVALGSGLMADAGSGWGTEEGDRHRRQIRCAAVQEQGLAIGAPTEGARIGL